MRITTLLPLLATTAQAAELLSIEADYQTLADVAPHSTEGSKWCITSITRDQGEEFRDGLGCGMTSRRTSPETLGNGGTAIESYSSADNRVGATGTSTRSSTSLSYFTNRWGTWGASNIARIGASSVRDDGTLIHSTIEADSVLVIDTTPPIDTEGRNIELRFRVNGSYFAPDVTALLRADYKVFNHETDELLFHYVHENGEGVVAEGLNVIPWNENLGDDIRIEFSANGNFNGIPNNKPKVTGPRANAFFNASTTMLVPELSTAMLLITALPLLAFRRRR